MDADGRLDLFTLGADGPSLARNRGERGFVEVDLGSGAAPLAPGARGLWADFDADGRLDLLLLDTARARLLLQAQGLLEFEEHALQLPGIASGSVLSVQALDEDGDGFADLFVQMASGHSLLRNRGADSAVPGGFEAMELPLLAHRVAGEVNEQSPSSAEQAPAAPAEPPVAPGPGARATGATGASASARASVEGVDRDSVSTGSGGGWASGIAGAAVDAAGIGPAESRAPVGACAVGVQDLAGAGCLSASSIPALGTLYPLGPEFFISSTGEVGIGTLFPSARLEIDGNGLDAVRINQGDFRLGASASLVAEDSGTSPRRVLGPFGSDELFVGNDSWAAIHVGPTASLTVEDTGRVGVNQPLPQASLDVSGNGLDAIRVGQGPLRVEATSSVALEASADQAYDALASFGGDDLLVGNDNWNAVHVGPTAALTVESSGHVGVNQPQPLASLDVSGNGSDAMRVSQGRLRVESSSTVALESSANQAYDALASFGGEDLLVGNDNWNAVHVGPTAALTVDSTGRVGVNQSLPQASLDVAGNGLDALRVEQGRLLVGSSSSVALEDASQQGLDALASFGSTDLFGSAETAGLRSCSDPKRALPCQRTEESASTSSLPKQRSMFAATVKTHCAFHKAVCDCPVARAFGSRPPGWAPSTHWRTSAERTCSWGATPGTPSTLALSGV